MGTQWEEIGNKGEKQKNPFHPPIPQKKNPEPLMSAC